MTGTEHLLQELGTLTEGQLREVMDYVAFLKLRSRLTPATVLEEARLAALYGEFSGEDRSLAEEGMRDYAAGVSKEDRR